MPRGYISAGYVGKTTVVSAYAAGAMTSSEESISEVTDAGVAVMISIILPVVGSTG
jgi:hypothetical protein